MERRLGDDAGGRRRLARAAAGLGRRPRLLGGRRTPRPTPCSGSVSVHSIDPHAERRGDRLLDRAGRPRARRGRAGRRRRLPVGVRARCRSTGSSCATRWRTRPPGGSPRRPASPTRGTCAAPTATATGVKHDELLWARLADDPAPPPGQPPLTGSVRMPAPGHRRGRRRPGPDRHQPGGLHQQHHRAAGRRSRPCPSPSRRRSRGPPPPATP